MNRILNLLLLLLSTHGILLAQTAGNSLSLQEAIETGLRNNIGVRQSSVRAEAARVNYSQAKANLLPEVNASVNHGLNQGRSIDPFTNAYVNQEVKYATYAAGASLVLFSGLVQQNTIRQTNYAHSAAELELQQARDNLSLSIMLAYLQVLSNEDQVAVATRQVAVTEQQLERLQVLHEKGAINPPEIAELTGQLKLEELALANNRNMLQSAKLALAQLMNVPYNGAVELERLPLEELVLEDEVGNPQETYTMAIDQLALVKAANLRTQSAAAGIRASRGLFYPTLLLNGNLNSNYSSAATINGERIYYDAQLRNNLFTNVGLTLRIPILNGLNTHYRLKLAKLDLQDADLAEETTRTQLRLDIEQAHLNMSNARERYQILQEQVAAFQEAFRAAEIRFNSGVGTPVDYLIAKNNLDRSGISLITAKYDYLLRMKILEFYRGR
ncbi:TolC family protein [Cesiribacter sp. SM1]|uniref:TolC family protein n=1 Tax=Cesiribacter sp. SM1 TaxID=2861196 RepID=UPI001CD74CE2|nr:TolC family protein [Cesiribacter sp. SM1]